MRERNVWVYALGFALSVSLAACGGSQETSSTSAGAGAPAGAPAGMKVDTATAGSVTGSVVVDGVLPKNQVIKMNADPVCMKEATGEQLQETYMVGSDGKTLGDVFVYVKDGLGNYVFDTPTEPAHIDQKGCRYHPHVFGVRVGQPIEISNSDPTLHNIHALPKENQEFNTAQPLQNMKITHTFDKKEVMVPFKCEVHGWMNSFVGVLDHPYFAVTSTDGKFELKDLPAGTYTVEAWHEKLGTQSQSVTIAEKETKDITFTFKAPAAAAN
ncbi:MAG TPA: carboxypeptidase regulatory-like domain-containing protein [Vicinamibacterales bacterium]|jgi:plastocyanin|nr:carboxypeptidase regulatory-like domain-containing protein [Vicinamibacterales bacterium]